MKDVIVSEFKKSMLQSIAKYAKKIGCDEKVVKIAFELSADNQNVYKVFKDYSCTETVRLDDILFLNVIYSMFKSQIPGVLNRCLLDLTKECESNFMTVFVTKSVNPGEVRMMLYVKGKHIKDISVNDFIKL